jgi:hypothetical protein
VFIAGYVGPHHAQPLARRQAQGAEALLERAARAQQRRRAPAPHTAPGHHHRVAFARGAQAPDLVAPKAAAMRARLRSKLASRPNRLTLITPPSASTARQAA